LTITGTLTNFNSSSGTLANGTYTVGGTLEFTGANIVNNAANLTISGTAAKILNGSANGLANFANNTGSFTVTGDGNFTTGSAAFTNSNLVTVSKGSTMTVGGGDAYSQSAGTTTVDGTLTAYDGINVTGGTIQGAGTLSASVTVGGSGTTPTISAGDSGKAGLLVITGSYTQLSTATMNSFIGGSAAGTQYSQLQVSGTATLAGTLTVTLAGGFTPTIGSTFTVLTASSITDTFSNTTIAINSSEHFNVSYTSTGVVLTVASGAAPQSGGLPQSNLAAVVPTKRQTGTSNLRDRISGTSRGTSQGENHVIVAGMENVRAGSRAIVADGYGWSRFGGSDRLSAPVAAPWEHITSGVVPVVQGPRGLERAGHSDTEAQSWIEPVRVSPLRTAGAGTLMRREPVKILAPMLPRLRR
jgi:hypothetical protein